MRPLVPVTVTVALLPDQSWSVNSETTSTQSCWPPELVPGWVTERLAFCASETATSV
jgi:hypothetical protein